MFHIHPCATKPPNVNWVKVWLGYQKGPSLFIKTCCCNLMAHSY
jgi:hypothetical protein